MSVSQQSGNPWRDASLEKTRAFIRFVMWCGFIFIFMMAMIFLTVFSFYFFVYLWAWCSRVVFPPNGW